MSPNWYLTAPQVAPISLAIRLADAAPGRPGGQRPQRRVEHGFAGCVAAPVGAPPGGRRVGHLTDRIRRTLDFHRTYCDSWRMAKPPLSMKPTGWFQVAWSDEIGVGDVHRMKYFDQRHGRLARAVRSADRDGRLLRAPRRAPRLRRPRRGRGHRSARSTAGSGTTRAATSASRTRTGPTAAGGCATYPGGRAQRVGLHLARRRRPRAVLRRARRVRRLRRRQQRGRLLPAAAAVPARAWSCIRSTCSRTAWTSRISSSCTRRRSCRCSPATTSPSRCRYVDFTITFEGDDGQKIEDVNSGVEAINGGLGIAVTKSWGMVDNRTISAITPVDESTSDVRFMVYIGRTPGQGPGASRDEGAGVRPGSHPAVRARTSTSGRTSAIPTRRRWRARSSRASPQSATGPCSSIPTASAAAPPSVYAATERLNRNDMQPIRVFQVATGNVGSEMIKRIGAHPDLELDRSALLLAGEGRPRRRRARRARRPTA